MISRTCQNCDAAFDRHDVLPFIFMRTGNTINCLHCLDLNYLIPTKTPAYYIVLFSSTVFGLFVFSLAFKLLGFMGIRPDKLGIIGTIFSIPFILFAAIISFMLARFILKLWNFFFGQLSLDDNQQSFLDL